MAVVHAQVERSSIARGNSVVDARLIRARRHKQGDTEHQQAEWPLADRQIHIHPLDENTASGLSDGVAQRLCSMVYSVERSGP